MQRLSPARISAKLPPADLCAKALLDTLPPVMWFVRRQMRANRGGLSLPQFRALVRVDREPDASLSAVAEHLGASLPTASRIVTGLVVKGLLTREGSAEDRRRVSLALTPRGREVLHTARAGTQKIVQQELVGLSSHQRATVLEAMEILQDVFGSFERPRFPPSTK